MNKIIYLVIFLIFIFPSKTLACSGCSETIWDSIGMAILFLLLLIFVYGVLLKIFTNFQIKKHKIGFIISTIIFLIYAFFMFELYYQNFYPTSFEIIQEKN